MQLLYLVISCNKCCNCMEITCSSKLRGPSHHFKVQELLSLFLCQLSLPLILLFLLHSFPDFLWNCPVVQRYLIFLALLFIQLKMLTNMLVTQQISSLVECLPFAVHFNEVIINPGLLSVCVRVSCKLLFSCGEVLADYTPSPGFRFKFILVDFELHGDLI